MRNALAILGLGFALQLAHPVVSWGQTPDAIIELSGGSVSAGIGYSWGSGTLIFQGKRYPLNVSGLSIGSVGISDYTAAGNVTGLNTPKTSTTSFPQ